MNHLNKSLISSSKLCLNVARTEQVRNMATLKDLKIRLGTVKTISKLTKTLHMVASSKLRSAEKKAEELYPYNLGPSKVLDSIKDEEGFVDSANSTGEERSNKKLLVAVTTDTGMCGPVNHQIIKSCKAILKQDTNGKFLSSTTGLKGVAPLMAEFPSKFSQCGRDFGKSEYSFPETLLFLSELISKVPNFDSGVVVFNKFKNALSYNVVGHFVPGFNLLEHHRDKFYSYMTSEDRSATMKDLSEFYFATSLWVGLYQNRASEMAARMISMDNASKNGESISQQLSLQYNRVRQAMITSELIEITSGASAIESSSD
ncbi:ATP synthase gamma chain [Tieghemostelium lacteum]|uniref:ATP synthase subunit gamma n=1 Tax=Tieghemostelium lacteum TaxID=361077 RepID=A0A152A6G3_TIELA|nr:ATP synthase gamma chain [Tieghemostelium lacteum]|eukprot:KYR01810.1 ATP synthase gamma chain [Tieghemostelium lacteum]